jgi:hypothetical protein
MSIPETDQRSWLYGDRMVGIGGGLVVLGGCRSDMMVRPDSPRAVMSCLAPLLICPRADSPFINGVPAVHSAGNNPCSLFCDRQGFDVGARSRRDE